MIHTTKDGVKIPLSELKDSHLQNIIKFILRRSKEGVLIRFGCADDLFYDEYALYGKDALDYMNYDKYIDEQQKRLLNQ